LRRAIRPASSGDLSRISFLSYVAGQGHVETSAYDLMIPGHPGPTRERLGFLSRVLNTRTISWFHHTHYTVAEERGEVAAALSSCTKEDARTLPLLAALKEVGWTDGELEAMSWRMQPFLRAMPGFRHDAWIIENVACMEHYRRRGLAQALLEEAVQRGSEAGCTCFQLNVYIGNELAIKAYEKCGFRVEGEKRDPAFETIFGCPGMYRMTLETALGRD